MSVVTTNLLFYSYIAAIKNDSIILNGFTNGLAVPSAPPVRQVTFEDTPDSAVTTENVPTSNNNNRFKTTARSISIVGVSELKLLRYKLVVVLGICFIITLFTLPIIFYYVEGSSEVSRNITPATGISNINISQVPMFVCMYVCIRVCVYVLYMCMCVCMYACMYRIRGIIDELDIW